MGILPLVLDGSVYVHIQHPMTCYLHRRIEKPQRIKNTARRNHQKLLGRNKEHRITAPIHKRSQPAHFPNERNVITTNPLLYSMQGHVPRNSGSDPVK